MDTLREYLLFVTAAAFICAIARSLAGDKGYLKLLCGIFLAVTVIRPLKDVNLVEMLPVSYEITQEAQEAALAGEEYASNAMAQIIKQQSEAYILDKASGYGAELSVDVTVAGEDIAVPVSVTLRGNVSPYVKTILQDMIQQDLGISREDQTWSGETG